MRSRNANRMAVWLSLLLAIVSVEHYEAQDGQGYWTPDASSIDEDSPGEGV